MTNKKKPSKASTAKPVKAKAVSSPAKPQTKEQMTASIIPFNPFGTEFTNSNTTMETLMNNQKNQFEKFSCETGEQARQAADLFMKSGTTMMKGMEQIMKTCMTMAQESSEKNAECMKQLMACKTMNDFSEAQNKIAQQNFDDLMQNATKLSEICIKVCTEAFDPINDQLSKAIKKASEQMAA